MKKNILIIKCALIVIAFSSCKKFLDIQPQDTPTEANFYVDEKGIQGGLISCYDALQNSNVYGTNMISLGEVRSDNVSDNDPGSSAGIYNQIENFSETSASTVLSGTWLGHYATIYRCNVILEKIPDIQMAELTKNRVIGQAKFIRALAYFNLTRLWGKVPLILQVQKSEQARLNVRATSDQIYQQIIADLKDASLLLPTSWPLAERGRVTSYASAALLGKVYIYQKKPDLAVSTLAPVVTAIYANDILGLVPQPQTFPNNLKTSKDIIFAVQYLSGGVGESVARNSRYRNNANNYVVSLPQSLFETTDNRKALVAPVGTGLRPIKFDVPAINEETSGDFPIIRCAEVLLIYAEALNEIAYGNTEAFKALNAVRANAGITSKTNSDLNNQAIFKTEVYLQRRLELALETDRWFDIVRTNQMATIFQGVPSFRALYPIPQVEIDNITNKIDWQNTGY
jgi:hypothetical protein